MQANLFDVKDRVFIITGGAGLLGRRYTPFLSRLGAHVVVADVNKKRAAIRGR
jgi:NAD(P)-dependent dehydrogenase (short-subunit alcohol dehydrogenase family)